jgi:molecular chaperone GrpE (heat shock protein)
MIAQDPEWSQAFKNHYVYNLWNYYFESSVQLDTDAASIETEIDQPSVNVLNDYSLTTPTVADVEDEMLEVFKDDYLEFSLNDTSEEGQLQEPHEVIMLPENDRMVLRLNEITDEHTGELYMDTLSDNDQIEHVSNDNISEIMSKEFNSMLQDLLPVLDNLQEISDVIEDMKSFDKAEIIKNHYIPMLEKMDLFTYLNMEEKENE